MQELVKSANLLFASFESSYIWEFCGDRFEQSSQNQYRINDSHVGQYQSTSLSVMNRLHLDCPCR
jgi:hypothetical protein